MLLFYKKLLTDLLAEEFEPNSHGPCIVNKMVGGTKLAITWHVDDLKVSQKNSERIEKLADYLKASWEDHN